MNAGLLTSFIVAGILIVSIITMNNSVSNNSSELTMTQFNRSKMATVSKMISDDIQKIGFNGTEKTDPMLVEAGGKKITFRSDIDNEYEDKKDEEDKDTLEDMVENEDMVKEVTWEFTSDSVDNSNPNDYVLMRTVKDLSGEILKETPIALGVTEFNIAYYNDYGVPLSDSLSTPVTSQIDYVKQFYIKIKLESPEKIYTGTNSSGRFVTSVWEKRFSPPNLECTDDDDTREECEDEFN